MAFLPDSQTCTVFINWARSVQNSTSHINIMKPKDFPFHPQIYLMPTLWNTVSKVKLYNFRLVRFFHSLHSMRLSLWKSHGYVVPAKHPQ